MQKGSGGLLASTAASWYNKQKGYWKEVRPVFSECERVNYAKAQLAEVICQLRFPTILRIGASEPAEFQERIREDYPRYSRNVEKQPPKLTQTPQGVRPDPQPDIVNYQFLSGDGRWKVNLTSGFVSLATPAYSCWENFARRLDEVLAHCIEVYHPAFFERIGLRYINIFSRSALGLEEVPFRELFQPAFVGLLGEEDVRESAFQRASQDVEMLLAGGCRLKLHAGPGLAKRGGAEDKEVKFILDQDVYMPGKVEMKHSAGALNTLHIHAGRIFRGAITQQLHEALEPQPI